MSKTGHYVRVCKSVTQPSSSKQTPAAMPSIVAVIDVLVNDQQVKSLIDSGSCLSRIDPSLVQKLKPSAPPESKASVYGFI